MEGVSANGGGMTISELQEAICVLRAAATIGGVGFRKLRQRDGPPVFLRVKLEVLATA